MSVSPLEQLDLLWLRDRAIGSTGVSVVIADAREPGFPLVDVNPAFERMTGYTLADIKGQSCRLLQGPKSDPAVVTAMRDAIRGKRSFLAVLLNYRKDGTPFWNELHISPVHDLRGLLTHFVGVQTDVTERERSSRQLRLLADIGGIIGGGAQPDEIVEAMAEAIVPGFADLCTVHLATPEAFPRWKCTYGADQDLVELTTRLEKEAGATVGRHTKPPRAGLTLSGEPRSFTRSTEAMFDIVSIDDRHRARLEELGLCAVLVVPIVANDIVFGAIQLLRFDPEPRFSRAEIELARDIAGRAGAMFEQARLLERAQTAIATRDRFLSVAAHELRTPVTSVKGYAQLLSRSVQQRSLSPERLRQALRAIEASVARLSTLTDDLIGMSQREMRELPLRKRVIHVPTFIRSIVDRTWPLLDHPVHLDPALADVHILGDIAKLEQVVLNLIENAARYSPRCTPIAIGAVACTSNVMISVGDQGLGLTLAERDHIFEPFGHAEDGEASDLAGLGLGLFISKGNIERHGGRIWAESAGRNKGTTVRFALPLHLSEEPQNGPSAT